MKYILFDDTDIRISLLPLTYTRPVAHLRIGIFTIAQKWEQYTNTKVSFKTAAYLTKRFPSEIPDNNTIYINGALCPDDDLAKEVLNLKTGEVLTQNGVTLAYVGENASKTKEWTHAITIIKNLWDIFVNNGIEIRKDYERIKHNRQSQEINDPHTIVYNPENIFVEEGVKIRAAVLNAEDGPIYLGKNSEVQEGALIKGPFALCEGSVVNMGGKMRGDNTIGPFCKVGGEISNSVIIGYSNKGHDGFLGNSIIGEWCNLGADSNTSNLKNNYGDVQIHSYANNGFINTGRQFCGLIMGDHSKAGINTMFNTGTVVGVGTNIFGSGFPPKFIPSFSWGGAEGFEIFKLEKAFEVAERVMSRRNKTLDETDREILREIFDQTYTEI